MVQVYAEALQKRHYAGRFSAASAFRVASHLAVIILTIIITYSSESLWLKVSTFTEQPTVLFTHDALLLLEGSRPGQERVWSTFKVLNDALYNKLASVDVKATELDIDNDGKNDIVDLALKAVGAGPVHSAKLLLSFRYELKRRLKLRMQSLAYVQHASPLPGSELHVDGELRLRQRLPLHYDQVRLLYDSPALAPGGSTNQLRDVSAVQFHSILQDYLGRNETTELVNSYPVWHAGDGQDFTIYVRVRIPPQETVQYTPGVMEVLKFAWMQLIAVYIVLWYLLSWVEYVTFHYRVLQTRVVSDLVPKQHRF